MLIRSALPGEARTLSALAFRSKGHWPYDSDGLAAYRPQLEVFAEDIAADVVWVGIVGERTIGFYALAADAGTERLHFLFVEPEFIGRGYGKGLWTHALTNARERGWRTLTFYADQYAVAAFYAHQNCRVVGAMTSDLGELTELQIDLV